MAPYFRPFRTGAWWRAGGVPPLVPAGIRRSPSAGRPGAWAWASAGEVAAVLQISDLARVRVTHRWSGRIGTTGDDLPVVGLVPG
ncbi:hypothetical protein LV779_24520 [Streptomyces thinghirensis]|nr:hypothetical protein [Streptomyces thinghirensis]